MPTNSAANTPTGTSGTVLQGQGAGVSLALSTATYPATTTVNQILYSSATNTVGGLATANRGVLTTGTTGIPVITALATDGQLIIGSTAGVPAAALITSSDSSVTVTSGSNSISLTVAGGSTVGKTITGNSGGALAPTAGNWNILGNNTALNGFATYNSGSVSTLTVNSFGRNIWVVNPTSGVGTHTTIQAAVTAASAGDTIVVTAKSTAYTENITAKAGVNIVADTADAFTPNVTISGTLTHNTAGTVTISGIRLQTNSAAAVVVSGSNASVLNLINCYINCTNNTGITFSASNSSAIINVNDSRGDLGTTGIALFAHSSTGTMTLTGSAFGNSGGSSTASTCSAGVLNILRSNFVFPITMSSTGNIQMEYGSFDSSPTNTTTLTLGGIGQIVRYTKLASGSASSISISTTATITNCEVNSSNTNAITGAGTITCSGIIFTGTSTTINTTTQTACGTLQGSKNTAPAAGFLGERITATGTSVAAGSTGAAKTITSISLTAGVWDITAIGSGTSASINLSLAELGISTTTNTFEGAIGDQISVTQGAATFSFITECVPAFRVVITATTTYYAVMRVDYLAGSPTITARISAVRVG